MMVLPVPKYKKLAIPSCYLEKSNLINSKSVTSFLGEVGNIIGPLFIKPYLILNIKQNHNL